MKMKIHHTGIIISNIEKSIEIYKQLGYTQMSEVVVDKIQHLKIVFLKSSDETQNIELIESLGDESTIHNFKNGLHHMCFDVRDIQDFTDYFKTLKIGKIFTKTIIAPAIDNCSIVFALLHNGMFVEFIIEGNFNE